MGVSANCEDDISHNLFFVGIHYGTVCDENLSSAHITVHTQ